MLKRILIISGILSSILFISTLILAKEEPSSLFEGFSFPMGDEREVFVTDSFDDLFNIFGNYSKLTKPQKKDKWREYNGKYVRWTGVVSYKGLSQDDWNRIGIRHNVYTNVELIFDKNKENIVKMIRTGDTITYTGKLSSLFDRNLLFKLEDSNVEIINDTTVDKLKSKLEEVTALSIKQFKMPETSINLDLEDSSEENNILSFEGLNKVFGQKSHMTQLQKEELWKNYRGKDVMWQGIVNYKGLSEKDWNRIGIKHKVGTNVELSFDEDNKYLLEMIKKDDNITYTGKLAQLFGRNLLCSVENVDIKKIGDKIITKTDKDSSGIPNSGTDADNVSEDEIIKEPEITLEDSMAPQVTEKEDLDLSETKDGFIELSFEELDGFFGKENKMTESQKDRLWKEYRNKYVRWTGEVVSRGLGRVSGLRMGIKHKEGTDIELLFEPDKEHIVFKTEKGDKITYTGKLVTRRGYIMPYKLVDGNIEKVVEATPAKD
jgi:nitrogen regulatory protein PII-like uncharacterized protein